MNAVQNVFNAGELSPKMRCRFDVAQFSHGFRSGCNFLLTPYGTVERRPGTVFISKAYQPTGKIRLIPFKVSRSIVYLAEFGNEYIRFFRNNAVVARISSVYTAAEIDKIDFVQSNDVMFLAHPDHPVMELRRTGESAFQLREMPIVFPAVRDVNTDETLTITPSSRSGNITLTASAALFEAGHVGGFFAIDCIRPGGEIEHTLTDDTASYVSSAIEVRGYWSFTTHGTWSGKVYIERSADGGTTYETYRTFSSEDDNNVESSGTEEEDDIRFRIRVANYKKTDSSAENPHLKFILSNTNVLITGAVKITAVTDSTHASARVVKKLGGTAATSEWCEGAWSPKNGYPRAISFFEERLVVGGSSAQPNTLWLSKTNNWNDFAYGAADDSALSLTLASDTANEIMWLCPQSVLFIGTSDSEWIFSGGDFGSTALTPSSILARPQTSYGSADVNGVLAGDAVLYVQTRGRKVRELTFSNERQGFISPDRTILAEHITRSGIVDTALIQQPDTMLWCLLKNGTIAAFTYESSEGVFGWQRVEIADGSVESIAPLPVPESDEDTIAFAVRRGNEIYIETLAGREYGEIENAVFVDSAVVSGGTTARDVVSGLSHLNGKTVAILADGAEYPSAVVSGGTVRISPPAKKIVVGLPFTSYVTLNGFESETRNGSTFLQKKHVSELRISMYDSVGGEARAGEDEFQEIISRDVLLDPMDSAIQARQSIASITVAAGIDEDTVITIRQAAPLPMNIGAIVAEVRIVE